MFHAGRALVFTLVLAVLASRATAAEIPPYIPDDTEFVLGWNVAGFVDSPLVKKHGPTLLTRYGAEMFAGIAHATGTGKKFYDENFADIKKSYQDVKRNADRLQELKATVQSVLFAVCGDDDNDFLVLVQGRFDPAKVKEVVEWIGKVPIKGIKVELKKRQGNDVYEIKLPGEDQVWFFTFLNANNLVFTPLEKHLDQALAKAAGTKKHALKKELTDVLGRVDAKQTFWLAGYDADEKSAFQGGLTVRDDIQGDVLITTPGADEAKELAEGLNEVLKGLQEEFRGLVKQAKVLEPLTEPLAALKPLTQANAVSLKVKVPATVLEKMLK